jgi:hypothetical protein
MQYSGGSFSQPAAWSLRVVLRQKVVTPTITEYFPTTAQASIQSPDWVLTPGYSRIFLAIARFADWCKHLQHGKLNIYILYILITIMALLAWKLG